MNSASKRTRRKLHPDLAVALRYQSDQGQAPRVVASGSGFMAERIRQVANQHGVPVHQDQELAGMLGQVEVGHVIPEELFEAVARVLAFIYRVDHRLGSS